MAKFEVAGWQGAQDHSLPTVDSLTIGADGETLYVGTRSGNAVLSYTIEDDQSLRYVDELILPEGHVALGGLELVSITLADGREALVPLAMGPNGLSYVKTWGDSKIGGRYFDLGTGEIEGRVTDVVTVTIGDTTHVYLSLGGQGRVDHYTVKGGNTILTEGAHGTIALDAAGPNIADLDEVSVGGTTFLVTLSQSGDAISTFRLDATGNAQFADTRGADDGLGIDIPTVMETAMIGGETYVVVAAAGSSSLSVMTIGADGALTPTDHVLDTRDTRFEDTVAMTVVEQGDRALVIAGGADDGLSVFELIPGGQLIHLGSVADTTETGLQNVQDVAATWDADGTVSIYAGSATEAGVTELRLDLGPNGVVEEGAGTITGTAGRDILMESAGHDRIEGGAGDDILMGGTGADTLTGGAGADVFILTGDEGGDATTDRITDFEAGVDRIELVDWEGVMGADDVTLISHAGGGTIRMGDNGVTIATADGAALTNAELEQAVRGGVTDTPTENRDTTNRIEGTAHDDALRGTGGEDLFVGFDGADHIEGGAGIDTVSYEDSRGSLRVDLMYSQINTNVAAGDTYESVENLIGSQGFDNLRGTTGDNHIQGSGNVDYIFGRKGDDFLDGGIGDDVLFGGVGADHLVGGAHRDRAQYSESLTAVTVDLAAPSLNTGEAAGDTYDSIEDVAGGRHSDTLSGDAGSNRLFGREGADTLQGRDGDDYLNGGAHGDRLDGGAGNDTLRGGTHADTFVFNQGQDVIEDFNLAHGDRIELDHEFLWNGSRGINGVIKRSEVVDGDTVIDFIDGQTLTLENFTDLEGLRDNIDIV